MRAIFGGNCTIWWRSLVTFFAAGALCGEIWNAHVRLMVGSYARFSHFLEENFPWQTNYLVTLEGESCWSPYCKWRLICDKSQSWESFFVAGTIFGDVGRWQARRNVNDVSCVGSIKQECQRVIVFCIQRLLRGMQITFHVSRLSAMVVAVPLCFE